MVLIKVAFRTSFFVLSKFYCVCYCLIISLQEYGLDLYFLQLWNDIRLAQGQDRRFSFSGNDIKKFWTPDTYFMNAKKTEIKDVSFVVINRFTGYKCVPDVPDNTLRYFLISFNRL